MIYQYVCKFYLNASHFIYINERKGEPHSHCFEFVIDIGTKSKASFVSFTEIEHSIENVLAPYQEQLLNEVEPFNVINPTLENIAENFKNVFINVLQEKGWVLLTLEVSETPTRSYIISVAEDIAVNGVSNTILCADKKLDNINTVTPKKEEQGVEAILTPSIFNISTKGDAVDTQSDIPKAIKQVEIDKPEYYAEIEDRLNHKIYKVKKNLNATRKDFDYEIPDELLHFDVKRGRFI